jgi:hypothetical protein
VAAAASTRLAGELRVSIMWCRFDAFAEAAGEGQADLITMVAALHHLGLADTLQRIPRLLALGGRLLVVGLAKVDSPADAAVDLISAAANWPGCYRQNGHESIGRSRAYVAADWPQTWS